MMIVDRQDIGIACASALAVHRPDGSRFVFLTFRGLRDAKSCRP